jgi:hypothetical protein
VKNFFDITDYIDREKGKTAYVCGMGPSLKPFLTKIEKSDGIIVACSDVDLMTQLIPNYWVFANSSAGAAMVMNERWKKHMNTVIVHSDSVDTTPKKWIEDNVVNTYIGYDQRHFNNEKCGHCPNACDNFIQNRRTIQELLMSYSKNSRRYNTGHTVALHCLAFALLLGCSEIYILGVDLDYGLGYVDEKTINNDSFVNWLPEIIEDFSTIKQSAENLNVKIYNMSTTSPLKEVFETLNDLKK